MRAEALWRATSFRLVLGQTLLFVLSFAAAALIAVAMLRRAEHQAVDAEIAAQVADLQDVSRRDGLAGLRQTIAARQRDPSIWEFRLESNSGQRVAGDLPDAGPSGWSTRRIVEGDLPQGETEVVRAFSLALPNGLRLSVGEDLGQRERADNGLFVLVMAVAGGAVALGLLVGSAVAWRTLGQIDVMCEVMRRYGSGDASIRVTVAKESGSDLDQLARSLNAMLDRTSRLMSGLRQVSADIAHDLRRPLVRHNERIDEALRGPADLNSYRNALEGAAADVDAALATFQSLLHIAELEAGAPGLELEPVDLATVAERVVAAYIPIAEQGQRSLLFEAGPCAGGAIMANSGLIAQLAANLVENALTHTPPGTQVRVTTEGTCLKVIDGGPGVPEEALSRIFYRFVRLDPSRTTPGNGLGLALARAIAQAFKGDIAATNLPCGFQVSVLFPDSLNGKDR